MTSTGSPDLTERRAIVTGGASGIGAASAEVLVDLGAEVVLTDVDEDRGAGVAERIGASFAVHDVGDPAAWDRVVATFGPFDIALLNAGVSTLSGLPTTDGNTLTSLPDDAYRRIMSVNLDGVVFGMRAVLPGMEQRGSGDIIATASMAGLGPISMDPVYGLTKHGVVGLVRSASRWFEERPGAADVCISSLCPGFTDTDIIGAETRAAIDAFGLEIMTADHVAGVVATALGERRPGAQWVIWPGIEPAVYDWNPPFDPNSSLAQ